MPAKLKTPFAESCCDGGATGDDKLNARPCGCDPRICYICEWHEAYTKGHDEGALDATCEAGRIMAALLNAFDFVRANPGELSDSDREMVNHAYHDASEFYDGLK